MNQLERKLKEVGVKLSVIEMDKRGYFVPAWKTIFINQNLNELDMKLTILHELKHALNHQDYDHLYRSFVYRLKLEREANDYMIQEIIKEYGDDFNYSEVVKNFKLGIGQEIDKK